jgi:hypothetical protein
MKENLSFGNKDWLRLETTIETIGNMIAYQCAELYKVVNLDFPDAVVIKEIRAEIKRLNKELLLCYDKDQNPELIVKAYTVYGPLLRR